LTASIDSVDLELLTDNVGIEIAYTTFVLKIDSEEMTGQN
jgi:hypothetical protein